MHENKRPWSVVAIDRMPNLLQESSLARIFDFYKNEDFGIVTSWKAAHPDGSFVKKGENRNNYHDLIIKVHRSGFGFVQVYGVGQETDPATGDIVPVKEPALLIPNRKYTQQDFNKGASNTPRNPIPFDEFRDMICDFGTLDAENPQTLVLVYNHQNNTATLLVPTTKEVSGEMQNVSWNSIRNYFTALRGLYTKEREAALTAKGKTLATPKTFSFEGVKIARIPDSWIQAQNRMADGELFELCGEDEFVHKIGEMMDAMVARPFRRTYSL